VALLIVASNRFHTGLRNYLVAEGREEKAGDQGALLIVASPNRGTPNSGIK
jgi:hypothetical protein